MRILDERQTGMFSYCSANCNQLKPNARDDSLTARVRHRTTMDDWAGSTPLMQDE